MQTEHLIQSIRSSSREMAREHGVLNNRFSVIGSMSQCHALIELDSNGTMNLGQLSLALNLEKSTTSRLAAQLSEKGACRIEPDANDRRNKVISLTKEGLVLVNKIHMEANSQVNDALELMTDEEKNIVLQGLSIYAKKLKLSRLQQKYSIRKLLKKDVPSLINLTKTIWAEFGFDSKHPAAYLFESELSKTYEIYSSKRSNYYVLVTGNKVVGGAGFGPLSTTCQDTVELKGMYLSPELRGLGLGASLLQKALPEAKKEGFKKCYIETMQFMHAANALYKKFGFIELNEPIGNTGHDWTNCWYIKEL